MAAKKTVRRDKRSARKRPARRKTARKARPARRSKPATRRKAARRPAAKRTAARRPGARKKAPPRKAAKPKPRPKPQPTKAKTAKAPTVKAPTAASRAARTPSRPPAPPVLDRARRQLSDEERGNAETERMLLAAKSGSDELRHRIEAHTETSPTLTAGDVDANWGDAYAVGDEAPGGDNPTPDQDRVDDIGKALGVNYGAGEELQGSDKIAERDRHRWELDPASSDDWPHDKD
jgi:hypothetical protein